MITAYFVFSFTVVKFCEISLLKISSSKQPRSPRVTERLANNCDSSEITLMAEEIINTSHTES